MIFPVFQPLFLYILITGGQAASLKPFEVEPEVDDVLLMAPETSSNRTANGTSASDQSIVDKISPFASSDEADSKTIIIVRRHGDFDQDNDKDKNTDNKETENSNVLKALRTKVMSGVSVDDTACLAKTKGPLTRLYAESKYFADTERLYTHSTAKEVCLEYGLKLADLEDLADHRSVQKHVSQYLSPNFDGSSTKKIFIAANDIEREGFFKMGDGQELAFQNFHLSQPNDNNQQEDCVALTRETALGPVGSADVDCNKPGNVLCMFPSGSDCYKDSNETKANNKLLEKRGLTQVFNITNTRSYYVSNFQLTWNKAMRYCYKRNMTLFNMDKDVTMTFFELLVKWESDFVKSLAPPLQYWTGGRFASNHMEAPIMWVTKPIDKSSSSEESSNEKLPVSAILHNSTFTWSGIYQWSTQKGKDPGGPYGYRKDICVTFSFEDKPEDSPLIRNSNCDIPTYFVCARDLPHTEHHDY